MEKKIIVISSWTNETNLVFQNKVTGVINKVLQVNEFKGAADLVAELQAVDAVFAPYSLLEDGDISPNLRKKIKQARMPVEAVMQKIAMHVQTNCKNDAVLVVEAGFEVKRFAHKKGKPNDIKNFAANTTNLATGQVKLICDPADGAAFTVHQLNPGNTNIEKPDMAYTFINRLKMVISGLDSGTPYTFYIRSVGRGDNGNSNWAGPVECRPK